MSSQQQQQQQQQPQKQRPPPAKKEKRPQLTHFLCLPLVNSTSLPQLEASLATFKAEIPPASHGQNQTQPQPLIPDAAIRPVGTLHLTLGVMSLPSKERLNEAIRFLQSLDLVTMVREAETLARARAQRKATQVSTRDAQGSCQLEIKSNEVHGVDKEHVPSPFSVSLESLHALPRARAATVLHAAPVDSTSRLYPFCEMLRDRFLDAGFLQGEFKKDDMPQKQQQQQEGNNGVDDPSETRSVVGDGEPVEEPSLPEEMPIDAAQDVAKKSDYPVTSTQSKPASSKPKPRPLLLHATVVNTIYIKGRPRGAAGGKKSKNNRYSFDARDILLRYRNYYLDSQRMMPRSLAVTAEDNDQAIQREDNIDGTVDSGNTSAPKPFIWARDFPIESVCICEMGAKKLDPDGDENGLNARLREKYTVVAGRSLGF